MTIIGNCYTTEFTESVDVISCKIYGTCQCGTEVSTGVISSSTTCFVSSQLNRTIANCMLCYICIRNVIDAAVSCFHLMVDWVCLIAEDVIITITPSLIISLSGFLDIS